MNIRTQKEKQKVLNLLQWVKDVGLWPAKFQPSDKFVIQVSEVLTIKKHVEVSQRGYALWVPSPEAMVEVLNWRGFICEKDEGELEGIKWVSFRGKDESLIGCGQDRTMATLDAIMQLKDKWSMAGVT